MQKEDDTPKKQALQYDEEALATGWQGPALVFRLASRFIKPGQTILDIGIGTGLGSERFARAGLHVYGMDISNDMLGICRKKGFATRLVRHDLTVFPYPFDDASCNHVVSTGVFQFFSDLERVFLEVHRILPGRGLFIFTTGDRGPGEPCEVVVGPEQTGTGLPVTMFRHTREQIEGWLVKNGFLLDDSAGFMVYKEREQETFPVRAYLARKVEREFNPMLPALPQCAERQPQAPPRKKVPENYPEINNWQSENMVEFTHIQDDKAQMVDISGKGDVVREAVASGKIYLRPDTLGAIRGGTIVKGNVLATARVAATLSVKNTHALIPMCHAISISAIAVDFSDGEGYIETRVRVKSTGKTGVEMEALTGVSVALLTIWDMVKSAEKDADGQYPVTRIEDIRVIEKRKG